MPESIQEYLLSKDFAATGESMIGVDANGDAICIPYTEFRGHTVQSFINKAKNKGWINRDGSTKVVKPVAPVDDGFSWEGMYTCVPKHAPSWWWADRLTEYSQKLHDRLSAGSGTGVLPLIPWEDKDEEGEEA